jgi:hypothetical protein
MGMQGETARGVFKRDAVKLRIATHATKGRGFRGKRDPERWPSGCVVAAARCECPACSRWAAVHRFNGRICCEHCCPAHGGKVRAAVDEPASASVTNSV